MTIFPLPLIFFCRFKLIFLFVEFICAWVGWIELKLKRHSGDECSALYKLTIQCANSISSSAQIINTERLITINYRPSRSTARRIRHLFYCSNDANKQQYYVIYYMFFQVLPNFIHIASKVSFKNLYRFVFYFCLNRQIK